jgi:hypothetical protein
MDVKKHSGNTTARNALALIDQVPFQTQIASARIAIFYFRGLTLGGPVSFGIGYLCLER